MNFRELWGGAAGLCLLLWGTTGEAKEDRLEPSSNWLVDWPEESCILARKFGTERQPFLLSMRSYAPGYSFQFTLSGKQISSLRNRSDLTIAFGSGEAIRIQGAQDGKSDGYGPGMIFSAMMAEKDVGEGDEKLADARPYPDLAFEKRLDRIVVTSRSERLVIETGPMAPALKALRSCTDDLAKQLGLDPEVQHSLSREASATNEGTWARLIQTEFPSKLVSEGKGARVIVRVVVDQNGKPSRCDAFQAFANTDFDVRACAIIMRRGIFEPALDKAGRPLPSVYSTVIFIG